MKKKIAIKLKAITLSTKGRNKHLPVHLSKNKGRRKACMQYTLYGRHVQSTRQSKLWIKRKIAKQNSKNKSKDKENIHLFQNKVLTMDEGHLELKLAIKIRMSIQTWTKICS